MPWPLLIPALKVGIPAAASLFGGLFGHKQQQSSTSTPTLDPQFGPLQTQLLSMITKRLSGGGPDLSGYTGSGMADINRTYDLAGQNLENSLTARGLATSPVAGAGAATLQTGRARDIAGFRNSIPLLLRNFQNQDLGLGADILGMGRGATTTATGTAGGGLGGGLGDLGSMLGFLIATGQLSGGRGNGLPGYTWPPR